MIRQSHVHVRCTHKESAKLLNRTEDRPNNAWLREHAADEPATTTSRSAGLLRAVARAMHTDRSARVAYDRTVTPTTTRLRGVVSYDGSAYVGWQTQPSGLGVQDVLEKRLSNLFGNRVYVAGSGRTDKGVHARAQVFHFELPAEPQIRAPILAAALAESDEALAACLQRMLGGLASGLPLDVQVTDFSPAPAGFHARDSCIGKRYVYTIHEGAGSPFIARYRWVLGPGKRLDVDAMAAAAKLLVGTHDFSTFGVREPTDPRDPLKQMRRLEVRRHAGGDDPVSRAAALASAGNATAGAAEAVGEAVESAVTICAECDRFLMFMMRMISGTLVQVGLGKLRVGEVAELLAARGRTAEPRVVKAPAHGLCLAHCFMEDEHAPWAESMRAVAASVDGSQASAPASSLPSRGAAAPGACEHVKLAPAEDSTGSGSAVSVS